MNNYKLAIENMEKELVVETTVILRQQKTDLVKIIQAIDSLSKIKEWQTVKELVFDRIVEKLEKTLQAEVKQLELNAPEIYRLQGKLAWAKRYSDLYKLAEAYKLELSNITKKLNENDTI